MSVSQIKEGSKFINEKLKDKAYFSSSDSLQRLLFNSIDLTRLQEGSNDGADITITPTMLENDKHIINVIYELLDKVERSKTMKESSISQHQQQINEINKLQKQNEILQNKLKSQEEKLYGKDMEIIRLNQLLKISNRNKHLVKKERNHLKMINDSLKEKQKIEIKRKNIEIDELRDKLVLKLNSSFAPKQQQQRIVSVQQSTTIQIPQQSLGPPSRPLISELVDKQTQTLLENSSNLIYELILTNEINTSFLIRLSDYFENLNNKISLTQRHQNTTNINNNLLLNKVLPDFNFKDFISSLQDGDRIEISDDLNIAINRLSNFEEFKQKFINDLTRFDQLILKRLDTSAYNGGQIEDTVDQNQDLIDKLSLEVEILKNNWNKLNENAEKWKKLYKDSTIV